MLLIHHSITVDAITKLSKGYSSQHSPDHEWLKADYKPGSSIHPSQHSAVFLRIHHNAPVVFFLHCIHVPFYVISILDFNQKPFYYIFAARYIVLVIKYFQ